jgi:8-oxo-dGTP pyrophosphatase MutT (NUDIX family)
MARAAEAVGFDVSALLELCPATARCLESAFPGGRVDPEDADLVSAALREAEEEIGLHAGLPEIVGELPPLLTGTGYLVTPVVALLRPPFSLNPHPGEVAETFEYPLSHVTDPAKPERRSREFRGEIREFWVWPHDRHYIWGATASVLVTLASVLRED